MAWLTKDELRGLYVTDSATEISDAQLNQCLNAGIRTVTKYVGEPAATEVNGAAEPYTLKVSDLREAQGKLAYRELLLIASSRFRSGGVLESEKDTNDSSVNKYEAFDKTQQRRAALFEEALEILEHYSQPDAPDELDEIPNYSVVLTRKPAW